MREWQLKDNNQVRKKLKGFMEGLHHYLGNRRVLNIAPLAGQALAHGKIKKIINNNFASLLVIHNALFCKIRRLH